MIRIIGPKDKRDPQAINTTSHSLSEWTSGLSPFKLGPINLYGNHTARIFENGWQFTKLYPQHADQDGNPTRPHWSWAQRGWGSNRPQRYPMGKGNRPLCALWNGERLGYIQARKTIYLKLYRDTVRETDAYRKLEQIYREQGSITLFDFDGYDHHKLGMSLIQVLNNPTRICGHAFILALMLTFGAHFTLEDLETPDDHSAANTQTNITTMYAINVVNKKTFKGPSEYIGRAMKGITASPLGNPYRVQPHGPYLRDASVLTHYRSWLWNQMRHKSGTVFQELIRLAKLNKEQELNLACWCAPELCHGEIIKNAINYLIRIGAAD